MFINNLVPVCLGVLSGIFVENNWRYPVCMGREEIFHYDLDDFLKDNGLPLWDYGRGIHLPLYHPFRLLSNILMFSFIFVVPVTYMAIYYFRKRQDIAVQGASQQIIINSVYTMIKFIFP